MGLAGAGAGAAPAAAAPTVSLGLSGVQPFEGHRVALAGERLVAQVRVAEATPGSHLEVRVRRGRHEARLARRDLHGGANTRSMAIHAPGAGAVWIRVRLLGGQGDLQAWTPPVRLSLIQPTAAPGDRGLRVRFLQRRLANLRYAVGQTGRYDWATENAVLAFRKVNRMRRVLVASRDVFRRVAWGRGAFRPRDRGSAHVEGDLTRQVLALVARGGRVERVYLTSSGRSGLRTPTGTRRFYRKEAGWNSHGQLDSAYFAPANGDHPLPCAIHGYPYVPTWNDSHCCFRVPIPDARHIFDWVRIGMRIRVYY
ncbi:MAG: hypothetical protein QOE65_2244 [Solirubrobacteraceae bacterium]|nr:hypothetical protein [Solirubrobacteraceae bacterium]